MTPLCCYPLYDMKSRGARNKRYRKNITLSQMAGVLRSCGQNVTKNDSLISFLVVSTSDLYETVSNGLLQSAEERDRRVVVHQCESIIQVLGFKPDTSIDFVIFAYDERVINVLSEIEENIGLIDDHYPITGKTILLHCNGTPNIRCPAFDEARLLCDKFNLCFMSANIFDPHNCKLVTNKIINLAQVVLGFNNGIPAIV